MEKGERFEYVRDAVKKGYSVMPAAENDNTPNVVKWTELQNRAMTIDELAPYWEKNPNYNIAIVTGKLSGITVIDVDGEKGLVSLNEEDIKLPDTYTVKTIRGWHKYYKYNGELETKTGILPGIDIRNDGGAVIAPGSTRGG